MRLIHTPPHLLPPTQQAAARAARLTFLLDKSTIYAKIIGDRMERQQIQKRKAEARAATRKENKEKRAGAEGSHREGLRDKPTEKKEEEEVEESGGKRKRGRQSEGKGGKRAKVEDIEVSFARISGS